MPAVAVGDPGAGKTADALRAHGGDRRVAGGQALRAASPAISVPSVVITPSAPRLPGAEIHHADEVGDEAVGRVLVDFVRRVALQQPAVLQHRHAVGHDQRFLLVVGDDDEGDADLVLQPLQFELHGAAQLLVERAERLVEQQQARPLDQRAGQRDALLLAAGELLGLAVGERGELRGRQHLVDPRADLGSRGRRSISRP